MFKSKKRKAAEDHRKWRYNDGDSVDRTIPDDASDEFLDLVFSTSTRPRSHMIDTKTEVIEGPGLLPNGEWSPGKISITPTVWMIGWNLHLPKITARLPGPDVNLRSIPSVPGRPFDNLEDEKAIKEAIRKDRVVSRIIPPDMRRYLENKAVRDARDIVLEMRNNLVEFSKPEIARRNRQQTPAPKTDNPQIDKSI